MHATEPAKFVHSLRHPQKEEDIYLGIMEDEEPVDTVHKWAMEHEIPKSMEKEVVDLACKVMNCTRQRALLYERGISYDGVSQGTIMVYDGEEPPMSYINSVKINHCQSNCVIQLFKMHARTKICAPDSSPFYCV